MLKYFKIKHTEAILSNSARKLLWVEISRRWKVMAAYRRVYDSRYLQADCKEPGPAPEPYGTRRHTLVPYSQEQEQQKNKNNDATEYQMSRLRYATCLKR